MWRDSSILSEVLSASHNVFFSCVGLGMFYSLSGRISQPSHVCLARHTEGASQKLLGFPLTRSQDAFCETAGSALLPSTGLQNTSFLSLPADVYCGQKSLRFHYVILKITWHLIPPIHSVLLFYLLHSNPGTFSYTWARAS